MNVPSREELDALVQEGDGPCVSMFMPMKRGGAETLENPTRFKNLLREAEKRLVSDGLREIEVKALAKPAEDLIADRSFWQHQAEGLAAFLSRRGFRYYRVPMAFPELVVVAQRFHVKPLLALLGDGRFYVLALSQKGVRLLECARFECNEMRPEKLPQSLVEALMYDTPQRQLSIHTVGPKSSPGGSGKAARGQRVAGSAIFHGHGAGELDDKANILIYYHQIDHGLQEYLRDKRAPLVLAGVRYLLPLYREANTYPLLMDGVLDGNFEVETAEELHDRALAVMEPYYEKAKKDAAEQYRMLAGTPRASHEIKEVVPAASQGRVGVLFVALGVQQWGTFNPEANEVEVHEALRPGDEDLLNVAAVRTLVNGGTVYAVAREEVPGPRAVAAVFRY
jgi:hypothetical protein